MGEPRRFFDGVVLVLRWIAGLSTIGWTCTMLSLIWMNYVEMSPRLDGVSALMFTFLVLFAASVSGIIAIRFGD